MAPKTPPAAKSLSNTRGLGRGLSTLLGDTGITAAANQTTLSDIRGF